MATRLQAIIDFAYKAGGIENAIGDMGKLAQGIGQVGRSATQMSVESAALDARTSLLSDKMNKLAVAVAQNKMTVEAATSEYQRFESKLISIPPAVDKTESSFQRMKGALGNAKDAWMAMATPIQSTIQTLQQAGQAAQQAYQYVGEGVQMTAAQGRFEALTNSVGTTSSAMVNDLRAATRGTVDDFKLMEGASQLLNLGLTKTAEETVRLGAVSGKLGWDMQVLGLTIANQSTMRLDALGLAIEDVQGRAERLRAQGMATDQAFKFAIIEAGEAKVRLLGDAADTTAGKLLVMEANAKNFGNSFKMAFSENLIQNINAVAGGVFETEEGSAKLGETLGKIATNVSFMGFIRLVKEGLSDQTIEYDRGREAARQNAQTTQYAADQYAALYPEIDRSREAMSQFSQTVESNVEATRQARIEAYEQSTAYAEFDDKLVQTSYHYAENEAAIAAANARLVEWGQTIPAVTGAIYASDEAVAAYNAQLGELYLRAQDTEESHRLINSGMQETGATMQWVSTLTGQQANDLDRMQATYDKAAQTIRDYELGIKGANLTDEERNKKIAEQEQLMATLTANMQPLIEAGGRWVEVSGQMVSFGPAVAAAFTESASAMGANANQLAAIQMAFSDLQPAQAESILKEAALAAEVQKLTQEIISGNMTVYEARDAYIAFQNGLNDSTIAVNSTTGSVILMNDGMVSAASSTQTLLDKFGQFPDEVSTTVKVDTGDAESKVTNLYNKLRELGDPALPTGGGGSSGGSSSGGGGGGNLGPGMAGGADFVVPPGYPNDSYPMRVQSGERVTVTPAGQQRGGNTYNLYVTAMDGGTNVSREFNYLKSLAGA